MAGKIAVIDHEFQQVTSNLKSSHQEALEAYKKVISLTKQLSSSSGPLYTEKLSPKVDGLMSGVESDVIGRLQDVFTQTEDAIRSFEQVIVNVDTSC